MYGAFSATPRSEGGLNAPSSRRPSRDERDRALVRVGVAERAEAGEPARAQLLERRRAPAVAAVLWDAGVVELAVRQQRAVVAVHAVRAPYEETEALELARGEALALPRATRSRCVSGTGIVASNAAIALPTFANARFDAAWSLVEHAPVLVTVRARDELDDFGARQPMLCRRLERLERLRPEAVTAAVPEKPRLPRCADERHRPPRRLSDPAAPPGGRPGSSSPDRGMSSTTPRRSRSGAHRRTAARPSAAASGSRA